MDVYAENPLTRLPVAFPVAFRKRKKNVFFLCFLLTYLYLCPK